MVLFRVRIECTLFAKADAVKLAGHCLAIHALEMDGLMLEPELRGGKARR